MVEDDVDLISREVIHSTNEFQKLLEKQDASEMLTSDAFKR